VEQDDYDSDAKFGLWLKEQRTSHGMTMEQAADASCIPVARLKSLEMGFAERGINQAESEKLSALYKVSLKVFLTHASGE
jgi:transcriptional regulator with XRE-family HTH domain